MADPTPQQVNAARGAPAVPFDREAYLDNPTAYLDIADGNRANQPAQPHQATDVVSAIDGTSYRVHVGQTVAIRVRTDPGMPVNLVSLGFGSFASGSGAISVAADGDGIATALFTATPGTIAQVPIQASSPVRAGVLNILVNVE